MKQLSDLVVSLELAKELNKRGIVKEGLFCLNEYGEAIPYESKMAFRSDFPYIPSATIDELLEKLPQLVTVKGTTFTMHIYGRFVVIYEPINKRRYDLRHELMRITNARLVNALAQMRIWLDDNKLLDKDNEKQTD